MKDRFTFMSLSDYTNKCHFKNKSFSSFFSRYSNSTHTNNKIHKDFLYLHYRFIIAMAAFVFLEKMLEQL